MVIFRPKPFQIFFFGLVPKSPIHIGLIYVKNISCLGPFKSFLGIVDEFQVPFFTFASSCWMSKCPPHRVHIEFMTTAAFWRTFHHDGKFCPGWSWWGCTHTHPLFNIFTIYHHVQSCRVLSSWEGRFIPLIFNLYPYVLCGPPPQIKPSEWYNFRSKVIKCLFRLLKDPDSKAYYIQ